MRFSKPFLFFFSLLALTSLACTTVMTPLRSGLRDSSPAAPTEGRLTFGTLDETAQAIDEQTQTLEAFAPESYTTEEMSQAGQTYRFTVSLAEDEPAVWATNWCASTQEILDQNFEHIQIGFFVNGESIDASQILVGEWGGQDGLRCRGFFILVAHWPTGATELTTRITFDEPLNDGMGDYPAGTHEYLYEVTVK